MSIMAPARSALSRRVRGVLSPFPRKREPTRLPPPYRRLRWLSSTERTSDSALSFDCAIAA